MLRRRYRSRARHVAELHARLRVGKAQVYVVEDDLGSLIALELIGRKDREAMARAKAGIRMRRPLTSWLRSITLGAWP